ncbi:Rv3654c family TadE-like protein [Saccharopolyspora sp. CA-218241]|uniref:Rv3654c family TadE-like protein n=1 Tax=Saccharopolyspora sp. CA-218241 TaxID=3240027 RepID=UPI003D999F6E
MSGDQGAATALSAGLCLALVVVGWFALHWCGALLVRHRAAGAADLAALAAAAHAPHGSAIACGRAGEVARGMGTAVVSCTITGSHARVEVRAPPPPGLPGAAVVTARARAGPVVG